LRVVRSSSHILPLYLVPMHFAPPPCT